jgi:hypothetical protein
VADIQIPSDQTGNFARSEQNRSAGGQHATVGHVYTLKKVTRDGKDGSVTMQDGQVVAFVRPT